MKIVGAIFGIKKFVKFFLMVSTLNFDGRSKTKKLPRDICKKTLDIECERDWLDSLGATLGGEQKIKKIYFSSFRDFFGKSRKCHIVGLLMYYKPTYLIKSLESFLRKSKF